MINNYPHPWHVTDYAKRALDVQDACNLSGVVNSLSEVTKHLWSIANYRHLGTEWVNHHPIVILFVDKLASLAGCQGNSVAVMDAFDWCEDQVNQDKEKNPT
jgi:hypothetical protein